MDKLLVKECLGAEMFDRDINSKIKRPGQAVGLAYTTVGGAALLIEAEKFRGNGQIILTGHLGDVMKESINTSLGWIRANSSRLGILQLEPEENAIDLEEVKPTESLIKGYDLHVNFPAAAIPKDGPSAGITIATTLVSLFTNRKVKSKLAMTGEITLHGEVLKIGGVKEKCIGALRNGIRTVILPFGNKSDTNDLGPDIKKKLKFHFVETIEEVLEIALEKHVY